jgi:hypothetical protein
LKAIADACQLCAPQAEQAKSRKGPIMTAVCSQCGDRCGRTSARPCDDKQVADIT